MQLTFQILAGLAGVMLLGLGTMSMFAPRKMVGNFAIEPIGAAGLSTIRSVIGGLFLASVALIVIALATGQTLGFVAVAILLGAVAIGRVVGIIGDGFDKAVVPPLIVEIVIIAILISAHTQLAI